ncbi:MATE family efflux transporter [Desulfocurvus sp. DL9XJH121]
MELNLVSGNVPRTLLRFAFPILVCNVLQSLYAIVDMAFVGRFVGSVGLAAVSNAAMLCLLVNSVCIGLATGGSVILAHRTGRGDAVGQAECVASLFALSVAVSAAVSAFTWYAHGPVFALMNVPGEAMAQASEYMRVVSLGTVFIFLYNAVGATLRGLGDSWSAMRFVAVAAAANVGLDAVLVGNWGLGVQGAGYATVAAQGIAVAAGILPLRRRVRGFGAGPGRFRPRRDSLRAVLGVGLPCTVQIAAVGVSYLLVTAMLNGYGVAAAAAAGIGLKINTLAAMPCWAVGQAVTVMAGQNMGRGDLARVRRTARAGLLANVAVTCLVVAVVQALVVDVMLLFDGNPQVVAHGVTYLRICCSANCVCYAVMYTLNSFATGVGDAVFAMANALLHSVALRLGLCAGLGWALGYGFTGICVGESVSPVLSALVAAVYYRRARWAGRAAAR